MAKKRKRNAPPDEKVDMEEFHPLHAEVEKTVGPPPKKSFFLVSLIFLTLKALITTAADDILILFFTFLRK